MIEVVTGDRVRLVNEGSTFTDEGTLVRIGEMGVVIGHRGFTDVIVHWHEHSTSSVVPRASLALERR